MRTGIVILVLGALTAGCGTPPPPPTPYRPIADTLQLMEWILDPAADVIWGSVGWIIDDKGVTELVPKTDEEWMAVHNAAALVAESANLLMMPSRSRDDTDWVEFCHGLVDAALLAKNAAEARDKEALFDAGGRIYAVCAACHQQYIRGETPEDATR
jgi:hypothetical protein